MYLRANGKRLGYQGLDPYPCIFQLGNTWMCQFMLHFLAVTQIAAKRKALQFLKLGIMEGIYFCCILWPIHLFCSQILRYLRSVSVSKSSRCLSIYVHLLLRLISSRLQEYARASGYWIYLGPISSVQIQDRAIVSWLRIHTARASRVCG